MPGSAPGAAVRVALHASLGPPQPADAYISLDERLADANPRAGAYGALVRATPGSPPPAVAAAGARVGAMIDERDMDGRGLELYAVGLKADLVGGALTDLLAAAGSRRPPAGAGRRVSRASRRGAPP